MNIAVVGKNYGDEGKGLAVAFLCHQSPNALVVKHNGGGQAGHTVEMLSENKRFIHHQIGSGAEFGARTLFSDSFHPDLFQLGKEMDEFKKAFGFYPRLYSEKDTNITTIDDVILNMAAESSRGDSRHGSCGMGINECFERLEKGYFLSMEELAENDSEWIYERLLFFREKYSLKRVQDLNIDSDNEYLPLLEDKILLRNFAKEIKENVKYLELVEAKESWLKQFDRIIFESGQGLLLDFDYEENMPYLTPSKTGIHNPINFLNQRNMSLDQVIYVTRAYVTRHGAGPLPCQINKEEIPKVEKDLTNEANEWQGEIRYARHESFEKFFEAIKKDLGESETKKSLLITHLNETDGLILFEKEAVSIDNFLERAGDKLDFLYYSYSRDSRDVITCISPE